MSECKYCHNEIDPKYGLEICEECDGEDSSPATCSAWQVWRVKICYNGSDEMLPVAQTFKARNKREAERKFSRYLAGRGIYAFRVFLPNTRNSHPQD